MKISCLIRMFQGRHDTGNYTCTATNSAGQQSRSALLTVSGKDKPVKNCRQGRAEKFLRGGIKNEREEKQHG